MWPQVQRYVKFAVVLALTYLGWVFLSRYWYPVRRAAPDTGQAARDAEWQRVYGGNEVKILQFYAREASVTEGEKSVICYGVLNAKSVRMEPAVDGVFPALNRCVEIAPVRDTRYTLVAEGQDGRMVSESFVLGVNADLESLPKITSFRMNGGQRDYRGRMVFSLSFSQQNGLEVSIDPPVFPVLQGSPNGNFYVAPEKTTTYTLTVTGKFGHRVQKQLVVEVPQE